MTLPDGRAILSVEQRTEPRARDQISGFRLEDCSLIRRVPSGTAGSLLSLLCGKTGNRLDLAGNVGDTEYMTNTSSTNATASAYKAYQEAEASARKAYKEATADKSIAVDG